ncbi:hypothetical protein AMECASPLE_017893 [Ameca splendens]|uniref:Uncharacterized protein n=1 Tax=Ameca splendens TaxID=208324 RepID=A0ABV0ZC41_9TELE
MCFMMLAENDIAHGVSIFSFQAEVPAEHHCLSKHVAAVQGLKNNRQVSLQTLKPEHCLIESSWKNALRLHRLTKVLFFQCLQCGLGSFLQARERMKSDRLEM